MNSSTSFHAVILSTLLWVATLASVQAYHTLGEINPAFFDYFLDYAYQALDGLPYTLVVAAVAGFATWLFSGGRISMFAGYAIAMLAFSVSIVFSSFPVIQYGVYDHSVFYYALGAFFVLGIVTSATKAVAPQKIMRRKERTKEEPAYPKEQEQDIFVQQTGIQTGLTTSRRKIFRDRDIIKQQSQLVNDVKIVE